MGDWARVKWSEARQVLEILGAEPAAGVDAAAAPAAYFASLVDSGRQIDAVKFLSQALPRLEAVAWAARTVRDLAPANGKRPQPEERALRAALLWVADPSEARRRSAAEAAEGCDPASAERMAAMAAFYSGGSIAPAHCPPVLAPRHAAGMFAAGAVMMAAAVQPDMKGALAAALDAGSAIARQGLEPAAA